MPPKKGLPRVSYLRPRKMSVVEEGSSGSCLPVLINMLNCWASYTEGSPQCARYVDDLKACMAKGYVGKPKREWHDFTRYLKRINPPPHD